MLKINTSSTEKISSCKERRDARRHVSWRDANIMDFRIYRDVSLSISPFLSWSTKKLTSYLIRYCPTYFQGLSKSHGTSCKTLNHRKWRLSPEFVENKILKTDIKKSSRKRKLNMYLMNYSIFNLYLKFLFFNYLFPVILHILSNKFHAK